MPFFILLCIFGIIFIAIPHDLQEMEHQEVLKKIQEKSLTQREYNLLEDFEKKVFLENGGTVR